MHCRFYNTRQDLSDCVNALNEALNEGKTFEEFLNALSGDDERRAVKAMRKLCDDFINQYDELAEN